MRPVRPQKATAQANDTAPWAAAFRATENQVVHDGADAMERFYLPAVPPGEKISADYSGARATRGGKIATAEFDDGKYRELPSVWGDVAC
ncbi:hypothetical protein [Pandoraea cepalis]|uniref:hypothetical protein n=1 Tax=Pandoraea cepalis TaxID=2508294 RepID=UPI00124107F1|nr:hypothetical protein [Pandoraea cepalis]